MRVTLLSYIENTKSIPTLDTYIHNYTFNCHRHRAHTNALTYFFIQLCVISVTRQLMTVTNQHTLKN